MAILILQGNVEGVFDEGGDAGERLMDGGTDLALAGLHGLDLETGGLGLDGGDVGARPAIVALVAEVELKPGRGVTAVLVDGDRVARGGGADALRVRVGSNVLGGSGLEGKLDGRVAVVPTGEPAVGADLVGAHDLPGLGVLAHHLDGVVVLIGDVLRDQHLVAAPGATDVAGVHDLGFGRALVVSLAEGRVLGDDVGARVGLVAAGRGRGGGGVGRALSGRGLLSGRLVTISQANGGLDVGLDAASLLGRGGLGGLGGRGDRSGVATAASIIGVGPADIDTVDGGVDDIADRARLVEVGVTVPVGGAASGTASAHGSENEERVGDMHLCVRFVFRVS